MGTTRRIKPRVTVTLDKDVYDRLQRLRRVLPGATVSGVVNEVLSLGLPVVEEMGKAMREAMSEDGTLDEMRARDALAKWAGAQLFDFVSDIQAGKFGEESDSK